VIIFYYQPTFRPPIQVGFFRAVFSTTKHVAYQSQETMGSKTQSWPTRYKNVNSVSQKIRGSVKWINVGKWWSTVTQRNRAKPILECIRNRLN